MWFQLKTDAIMSAKYVMQEVKDLNNEGRTLLYPRMELQEVCGLDELARQVAAGTTFGVGEVTGVISLVARWMAVMMGQGRPVKLDGVGTFTPALGLKKGREREEPDGSGARRNAASIEVSGVHFRVDKELVRELRRNCRLERSPEQRRLCRPTYSPQERLALAQAYLRRHPVMRVADYAALTGLSRTTAGQELRRWVQTEGSGIGAQGMASHRVYVLTP